MAGFRTYLLWFALTILHTWLFYDQSLGLNALIFSVIMVVLVTWHHTLQRKKTWWFAAGVHLFVSVAVFWHGTFMSIILYHFSAFALAGFVLAVQSSLPIAFINGITASLGISFVTWIPAFVKNLKESGLAHPFLHHFSLKRAYLYIAPATVTLIFYFFYSIANPDFFLELNFPDLEINLGLIGYIILGGVMLCPLIFPWGFKNLAEWDLGKPDLLKRIRIKKVSTSKLGLAHENHQGVVMFAMLNILIILFLCFNVLQIFIPALVQQQRNHSEQVHQGFETLIMSIIIAILLIMYYFRANQNFYTNKTRLVQLATIWILLNVFLAVFTCYKNILYVDNFGLTYKRIWVFIGIVLTIIGLYLTLLKITNLKTNWYLIRQNTWILCFMLTFYTLIDWDRFITWYNFNYAQELDLEYIEDLGNTKLPYLKELIKNNDPRMEDYKYEFEVMIKKANIPVVSWKSQTLDNEWLQVELER